MSLGCIDDEEGDDDGDVYDGIDDDEKEEDVANDITIQYQIFG